MPSTARTSVSKLTPPRRPRRKTVGFPGWLRAVICFLALVDPAAAAAPWHDTSDIAATAESFLIGKLGRSGDDTSVRAGMLDSRLKLAACDTALEGFLRPGAKIGPKTIVGVRCQGSKPWKMYVPVEVVVRTRVWVARQPLPRGHLLTRADLREDVRDVARMTAGYVSDPQRLIGQRLRTSVLAGRVLTLKLIEADTLVERGQTVTLAVMSGGISIRMSGKALMDGALNERIRVENLNSGRVVEGIVRSREIVEILVPETAGSAVFHPKVSTPGADTLHSNNDR